MCESPGQNGTKQMQSLTLLGALRYCEIMSIWRTNLLSIAEIEMQNNRCICVFIAATDVSVFAENNEH